MNLIQYSGFLAVTVIAIILVLRGCFFIFVCRIDPIKSIVPNISGLIAKYHRKNKAMASVGENS